MMGIDKIRVLIIEDDQVDQMAYERFIKHEALQYDYTFADSVESARNQLASNFFDVILSDYMLGDGTSLDIFELIKDTPIIVVTGTGDEETAVKAMKMGASDYLIKDPDGFYLKTLPLTVNNAIDRKKAETELKTYKENLEKLVDQRTEKLKESEERYRALITRMTNAFTLQEIICNEKGKPFDFKFLEVNAVFEEMAGITKEEIIGKRASEISPDMDRQLIEQFGRVALEETSLYFEHYDRVLDRYFDMLVYSPKKGQFATIFYDITARKTAEKEKSILEKQLLQTQKMEALGTLAGGIAHDFNNILSIIFGYIELSLIDSTDRDKVKENLDEISRAAFRAKDLINQILTISRKKEHEKHYIKVTPIIKEAVKLLNSTIPKSIRIEHYLDTDESILADPTQIHQLIINLCTNSYHAMKEKGGILSITLTDLTLNNRSLLKGLDLPPGKYIMLEVQDSGYGMDDETKEKIFDPYFTTKEIGEGTGLGLAVVHGIVKSCQGFISVNSKKGKGTAFYIFLPVSENSETGYAENPKVPFRRGAERILVVDDEQNITRIIEIMLSKYGYKVTPFNDSAEACEAFKKNPQDFDLIITDMTMPKMNGVEVARQVQEIIPDKPVIICSGYSDLINKEKALKLGLYYLSKPVALNDLGIMMKEIFEGSL
jgi:PAS domain S-box-containing protein